MSVTLNQEWREGNVETLPFMCVINSLCDYLPQEIGPGSVVHKAPCVLLNVSAPGVMAGPEAPCCVWVAHLYWWCQGPAEQAGHVHGEGFWFGSSVVPLGLWASLNLLWTKSLRRRELCCVRGVFMKPRVVSHGGAVGSVWMGVLSWRTLAGPACAILLLCLLGVFPWAFFWEKTWIALWGIWEKTNISTE